LDAVNVVDADYALIASVGIDHVEWLGGTRESVGLEKAGVLRGGQPCVYAERDMPTSVGAHAARIGARLHRLGTDYDFEVSGDLRRWWSRSGAVLERLPAPSLRGARQHQNAAAVLTLLELMRTRLPVTEPALDVRAVRRPEEDILVGSRVRGTMEEPEFTLFSEPPMSQQEQLSWLVLGRSLEEAPAGESSALAQASLALGVKGGNALAENIGDNLGVDEFGIESGSGEAGAASDPTDAALVIGKYLSPDLYLSYGIGLFNPISVLTMEYEINRRLKLMTESSSESTGADLVYTFERGE